MTKQELQSGRIYYISYGQNTQLIGMVKIIDSMRIDFFSHLHYWNGFETFHKEGYCVTSGIEEIREASKSEKYNLFKEALNNNSI